MVPLQLAWEVLHRRHLPQRLPGDLRRRLNLQVVHDFSDYLKTAIRNPLDPAIMNPLIYQILGQRLLPHQRNIPGHRPGPLVE